MIIHPFSNKPMKLKGIIGILSLLFTSFFYACDGGDIEVTGQTGSIAFKVEWETALATTTGNDNESDFADPMELDCESADITWVKSVVYNRYDELLAESPRWECSAHAGTIQGVKKGLDRWVIIYGMDEDLNLLYRGQESEVEVIENEITDVGLVVAHYFIPVGGSYNSATDRLTWLPVLKATSYEVQVSQEDTFTVLDSNMTVEDTMSDPSVPDNYTDVHYFWRVRATDYYNSQSAWSQIWEFEK